MADEVELFMTWGDTKTWEVTIRDQITGAAQNLNDGTLRLGAKLDEDDAAPLFELSSGSGITHLAQAGSTLGKAHVEIGPAQTSSLPNRWRTVLFDIEFTKTSDGEAQTPIRGVLRIRPRIGT